MGKHVGLSDRNVVSFGRPLPRVCCRKPCIGDGNGRRPWAIVQAVFVLAFISLETHRWHEGRVLRPPRFVHVFSPLETHRSSPAAGRFPTADCRYRYCYVVIVAVLHYCYWPNDACLGLAAAVCCCTDALLPNCDSWNDDDSEVLCVRKLLWAAEAAKWPPGCVDEKLGQAFGSASRNVWMNRSRAGFGARANRWLSTDRFQQNMKNTNTPRSELTASVTYQ